MSTTPQSTSTLRQRAEQQYAQELAELAAEDRREGRACPPGWRLSPMAVRAYLLGGKLGNAFEVSPKYIGKAWVIEVSIATLRTQQGLLLSGDPGTAKSTVSEHLAAAICGDSSLTIQGHAGVDETALRYGWNYALLIAEGPSERALVRSPLMRGMQAGKIVRIEELSRIPGEVQDVLISPMSEKMLAIPELDLEVPANKGFNLIATANHRDKGVNESSDALKRRFNTVVLPLPESLDVEVEIVQSRVRRLAEGLDLPCEMPALQEIRKIVAIFRDLRSGRAHGKGIEVKRPSATLSTAEEIDVILGGMSSAACFRAGHPLGRDFASGIVGTVVKDPVQDKTVFKEYLQTVLRPDSAMRDLYTACSEVL